MPFLEFAIFSLLVVAGTYVAFKVIVWLLKAMWYAILIFVGFICLSFLISFAARLL